MITKITAENELEFFARGFEAITKAFAAADNLPNIVVNSLESYYGNLEYIKQLPTEFGEQGKFLLVPFDEPFFEIDANARTIKVPDIFKKNGVAVQGDHQAELLVFKIDRYFDYQDLSKAKIAINWNFIPYGSRAIAKEGSDDAFAKSVLFYDANYVVFGFIVTKDMTPSRGTLNFSANFYTTSENQIDYSLNTITASVAVNEGLVLSDPSAVKPVNQNFLGRLGNSAYTPETQSPIAQPEWTTGPVVDNRTIGLPLKKNFDYQSGDNSGLEEPSMILTAQAYTPGVNTSVVMKYKWSSTPATNGDGVIVEREIPAQTTQADRPTVETDYFLTPDAEFDSASTYFKKDEQGHIIPEPISAEEAAQAMDNGEELYELGSSFVAEMAGSYSVQAFGYRETTVNGDQVLTATSNTITSESCVIPVAAKPVVNSFEVVNALDPDTDDFEIIEDKGYTYIDKAPFVPEVVAKVSSSDEDALGKIAVELVSASASAEDLALELEDLEDTDRFEFADADSVNGNKVKNAHCENNGIYQIRAINHRNHTYHVSDLVEFGEDTADKFIKTSYVAPAITNIKLVGKKMGDSTDITLLTGGEPVGPAMITYDSSSEDKRLQFTLTDNTTDNFEGAVTSYIVEEVKKVGDKWVVQENDEPNASGLDEKEIVDGVFVINGDSGTYRIRTENTYNGTRRIAYTGVFQVRG